MYQEHPVFQSPNNAQVKIWRYLDFTKFVNMLENKSLYFARADKLGDPFEGSYSKANINLRSSIYQDKIPLTALQQMSLFIKELRRYTLINCWHQNEYESAAMWKLYLKPNEGIAIQSTFESLKNCFSAYEEPIYIGRVKYIDYQQEWVPEGNAFYPFIHKRKSFEHENEIRCILQKLPIKNGKPPDWSQELFNDGLNIPVDLGILIQKAHVAPTSPEWFFKLVVSIGEKYGIKDKVVGSSLDEGPVW